MRRESGSQADAIITERHQAHGQGSELGGPATAGELERRRTETGAPSGQAECFGREGGIKKSRAPSSTPRHQPRRAGLLLPGTQSVLRIFE